MDDLSVTRYDDDLKVIVDAAICVNGKDGVGIVPGGITGQLLGKKSNADFDVEWKPPTTGLPADGTEGQLLTKLSSTPYDVAWQDPAEAFGFVEITGDTMTGPLILYGAPSVDLEATTKLYVDTGLSTKADTAFVNGNFVPLTAGVTIGNGAGGGDSWLAVGDDYFGWDFTSADYPIINFDGPTTYSFFGFDRALKVMEFYVNSDGVGSNLILQLATGAIIGSPTGGDKGGGSLNAITLYEQGVALQSKYQAIDPTLTAYAALVGAADRLPYFTGVDAFALTTFTSYARTLLDDADAATARATLGLVIGTNIQAFDATLAALAALDTTVGLVEQTGADAFTKRAIGVATATSVLTRADGDARYAAIGGGGGGGQPADDTLTALAALNATPGLVEQTGADVFTKRALGVAAATSVPTRADGDARWLTTAIYGETHTWSAVQTFSARPVFANDLQYSASQFIISSNTPDGADNKRISISGAGSPQSVRGAFIEAFGNENATTPGQLTLSAGTGASVVMVGTTYTFTSAGTARPWTAADTDIDGLISGTGVGGIYEGPLNGHLVLGVRGDASDDRFSIVGRTSGSLYTTLMLDIPVSGTATLYGEQILTPTAANALYAQLAAANTFTATQYLTNTVGGVTPILSLTTTLDDATVGPLIELVRNSASPAVNDNLGGFRIYGKNSIGTTVQYTQINSRISDPTSTLEDGRIDLITLKDGANNTAMVVMGGVLINSAVTGGDKGIGTLNATTLYEAGVSIATKYQALDATLTAFAALAGDADRLPYFTAADTFALATFTSFGRSLVDDADNTAARTTLGLGTAAVQNIGTSGVNVPLLSTANTWAGAQTFAGNIIFSGTTFNIIADTVDAADTKVIVVGGGGATSTTRGAYLALYGNEHATQPGNASLNSTGTITINAGTAIDFSGAGQLRVWGAGSDIDGLLPGTITGSVLESPSTQHLVLGVRGNDGSDRFAVVGYITGSAYNTLMLDVPVSGTAKLYGNEILTAAHFNTVNTWTAAQTISTTTFTPLLLNATDDTNAAGPYLILKRTSTTPTANDFIGDVVFQGYDSVGTVVTYFDILAQILDPTDGSEDGRLYIRGYVGGTPGTTVMTLGPGLVLGAATGGDKGIGTLNATALYEAGTALTAKYGQLAANNTWSLSQTFNANVLFSSNMLIAATTVDGSDTLVVHLCGGGGAGGGRGGYISVYGNEHASQAGNTIINSGIAGAVSILSTGALGMSGSSVAITGATTITASGTPVLTLVSTDSGAAVGPILYLKRSSSTPANGDSIGEIIWQLNDNAPATVMAGDIYMVASDVTAGSIDTRMIFRTMINSVATNMLQLTNGVHAGNAADMGVNTFNATAIYEAGVALTAKYAQLGATNTFTGMHTITTTGSNVLTYSSSDAGAGAGPIMYLDRVGGSPAANDYIGLIYFRGQDSALATVNYASIQAQILDSAAASKDSKLYFETMQANSLLTVFSMGLGVWVGNPTGGDKGAGTLNAVAVYDDNVLLTCVPLQREFLQEGKVNLIKWDALSPSKYHAAAHDFANLINTGFDPRNTGGYIKRAKDYQALPGMPTYEEWKHGGYSTGEMLTKLWLALEMLAVAWMAGYEEFKAKEMSNEED